MAPFEDMYDRGEQSTDHDLLIRLHERIVALQQQLQNYVLTNQDYGKRLDRIEKNMAMEVGSRTVNVRNNAIIATIISSTISGLLVYIFTHIK